MRRIVFAFILSIACYYEGAGQVLVKLRNQTNEELKVFSANIMGRKYTFNKVKTGQTIKIVVDSTYPYFSMEAVTAKDTIRLRPIDFVGEPLYKNGRITLTLTISERNGKRHLSRKTKRIGEPGNKSDPLS